MYSYIRFQPAHLLQLELATFVLKPTG